MENKEQKSRLQKYLKGKQQGVKINEDASYIKQVHRLITDQSRVLFSTFAPLQPSDKSK